MDDLTILLERADEKLSAAQSLLDNGFYSDSVSRAYYAMLYAARALLSTKNRHPKTHRGVLSELANEFVKTGELDPGTFELLASSQEDREDADYGLLANMTGKEAKRVAKGAETFIEAVKSIIERKKNPKSGRD